MASSTDPVDTAVRESVPAPARRRDRAPWGLLAAASAVAVVFAGPFAYLVVRNVGAGADLWAVLSDADALAPLGRTLLLATSVSAATAVLGTAAAWLVARTNVPGRGLLRVLLPLPLVIPSFIGAFAFVAAFATGGLAEQLLAPLGVGRFPQVRGFGAAFVVMSLLTFPYVYLPVAARLNQLPPSLEEAARLLGRRPVRVFGSVVLPQIRSAVLAGTLLVFLYSLSEFGAVQLLRYDTLTRVIFTTQILDPPTSLALSLELGVLALLVVTLERITARAPRRVEGTRALRGRQYDLGRWRPLGAAAGWGLVGGALFAPLSVLVYWTVRGLMQGSSRASALAGDLGALIEPALNTARVSVEAAVVSVVVALPISLLAVRHRSRLAGVANAFVVAGFALPGLAIALAVVFWTLPTPLYQTEVVLVGAYVVHFGAQSLRASDVAVATVPQRLDEAARVLGASRWRRLWTVDLPLMAPGLLAGAGLVLLSVMKELPATLLLAPTGFQTLTTRAWAAMEDAFFADGSIASLVLVALSGALTWVLVIRRSDAL